MRVNPRLFLLPLMLVLLCALLLSADEERWAIFGSRGRVDTEVTQENGVGYVELAQALAAEMSALSEPTRRGARIKAGTTQFDVVDGERTLRIRGKDVVLRSSALVKGNTVRIAAEDLASVLRAVTRMTVLERTGRMFIGDSADFANTQLRPGDPSSLILSFRNAVNPRVSADAKTVTLTFDRDPAVLNAPQSAFDDKTIASVQAKEQNGAVAVTVTGEVPLMVKFEDQNRRIVVTAAPSAASVEPPAATETPAPQPAPAENATNPQSPVTGPSGATSANLTGARTAVVAIDPAHGGADAGVRFSDKLIEKDVTLEIAEKIKAELTKLGISSIVLRTADEDRGTDERAEMANGAHVNFYVGVHAGQSGTGVRLYTAMPIPAQPQHGFMPWEQAQATFSDRSVAFSAAVASQLNSKKVAARQLAANTAPITHIAAAAVSIEVAPQDRDEDASLESQPYQQRVAQAVAAAIAGERSR